MLYLKLFCEILFIDEKMCKFCKKCVKCLVFVECILLRDYELNAVLSILNHCFTGSVVTLYGTLKQMTNLITDRNLK